jgi:hypothetical protein
MSFWMLTFVFMVATRAMPKKEVHAMPNLPIDFTIRLTGGCGHE